MRVEHYPDTDAVYVYLSEAKVGRIAGSADGWAIDFAEGGSMFGVEFWGISEGIDLGRCNSDCQQDPNSHVCTADFHYCQSGGLYGFFGIHSIETCKCIQDPATGREGMYMACETVQVCAICEKCVETDGGPQCTVPTPLTASQRRELHRLGNRCCRHRPPGASSRGLTPTREVRPT